MSVPPEIIKYINTKVGDTQVLHRVFSDRDFIEAVVLNQIQAVPERKISLADMRAIVDALSTAALTCERARWDSEIVPQSRVPPPRPYSEHR